MANTMAKTSRDEYQKERDREAELGQAGEEQ